MVFEDPPKKRSKVLVCRVNLQLNKLHVNFPPFNLVNSREN